MASVQIAGNMQISISQAGNVITRVYSKNAALSAPGGSPDGALPSTATPDRLLTLPYTGPVMEAGDQLIFEIIPSAVKTMDASDAAWIIPVRINTVQVDLQNSAQGTGTGSPFFEVTEALSDRALVAGVTNKLAVYTLKSGARAKLGGGVIFYGVEDNTS